MMNKAQAIAYGKRIGCRFYVYNENGGLLGGFTTKAAAEDCKTRWERNYSTDPWNKGMKCYIVEK